MNNAGPDLPEDRWRAFAALRIRNFRLLWAGAALSSTAQWVQQAALGWVVYELTGSSALLGLILGTRAVSILLLGPFAGVAADRLSPQRLSIVGSLVSTFICFALGAAIALDRVAVPWLFVFVLVAGAARLFEGAARHASILEFVPRTHVANAVAWNGIAFSLPRTLGPAVAGYLIVWVGSAASFFVQGLACALAAWSVARIPFPARTARHGGQSAWQTMQDGFRFVAEDRLVRSLWLMGLVQPLFLISIFGTLMPVFVKSELGAGADVLGLLLSAVGLGGFIGAVAGAMYSRIERPPLVQVCAITLASLALVAFGLTHSVTWAALLLVLVGACEVVIMTINQTCLQLLAPVEMRGRIAALTQMQPGFIALGGIVGGFGAQWLGLRTFCVLTALCAMAVSVTIYFSMPALRELRLSRLSGTGSERRDGHQENRQ